MISENSHPNRAIRVASVLLASFALCAALPLSAEPPPAPEADTAALHALLEGRVDEAESLLHTVVAQKPSDGYAHQLLCRSFYAEDQADAAVHECELAVAADPHSSDDFLWLGRAYGLKAKHANPMAAFSLARKVHTAFETAAALDPENENALGDLGDYYVEAPGIVGGGDDKARALATRIMPQYPSLAHGLLALIAQSNKDLPAAEQELKLAVSTARTHEAQSHAWIDLAHFYATHDRPDDALAAVRSGLALDRAHGSVLVGAATVLTAMHREPALAERCLRDYLAGHAQTDAAPVFKVHLQLAQLLTARGDSAEASREVATANALASGFHGARASQGMG